MDVIGTGVRLQTSSSDKPELHYKADGGHYAI